MRDPNICADCAAGQHGDCDGFAWANDGDAIVDCDCARRDHEPERVLGGAA